MVATTPNREGFKTFRLNSVEMVAVYKKTQVASLHRRPKSALPFSLNAKVALNEGVSNKHFTMNSP